MLLVEHDLGVGGILDTLRHGESSDYLSKIRVYESNVSRKEVVNENAIIMACSLGCTALYFWSALMTSWTSCV